MRQLVLSSVVSIGLASTALAAPGQLDATFGTGGKVTIDFGGPKAVARAIALQADGKIIVVGQTWASSNLSSGDFAVARLTSAGQFDATFGVGGKVVTDFLGGDDGATAVVLQPDGRILAGGFATGPFPGGRSAHGFAVVRYLSNGQLDSTFGIGGKVTTSTVASPYPGTSGCGDSAQLYMVTAIGIQPDGRVVVAGGAYDHIYIGSPFTYDIAVVRYNADGTLDSSLLANTRYCPGTNGIRIDNLSGTVGEAGLGGPDRANSLLVLPDGRLLVGGTTNYFHPGESHEQDSFLLRYESNGVPDATFGDGSQCDDSQRRTCKGVVTIDTHTYGRVDEISALALQADGKVTSVGQTTWSGYGGSTSGPCRSR